MATAIQTGDIGRYRLAPTCATPAEEWTIVVTPEVGKKYSSGRTGTPLSVYEELMGEKNKLLQVKLVLGLLRD